MRRRDFIKIIPGLAAAYPLLARAQQSKRRIGVVIARLENDPVAQAEIAALFDNLRQLGWTAGTGGNIQVDYRFPQRRTFPTIARSSSLYSFVGASRSGGSEYAAGCFSTHQGVFKRNRRL